MTQLTLTPAARSALLRASALGQQRLQRLLLLEAAVVNQQERYPELWAILCPEPTDEGPSAA